MQERAAGLDILSLTPPSGIFYESALYYAPEKWCRGRLRADGRYRHAGALWGRRRIHARIRMPRALMVALRHIEDPQWAHTSRQQASQSGRIPIAHVFPHGGERF